MTNEQYTIPRRRFASDEERRTARLERAREDFAALKWDRVGEKGEHPIYQLCERCSDNRARVGFSFCVSCSRCAWCGKNTPESGNENCSSCIARRREAARDRGRRLVGNREYLERQRIRYAKRWNEDAEYREAVLERSRRWKRRKQRTDPIYRERNKAVYAEYDSKPENKQRARDRYMKRYSDPEQREIMLQQHREWFQKNKKAANAYQNAYRAKRRAAAKAAAA